MLGTTAPDFSELAHHIVSLSEYWKQLRPDLRKAAGLHAIKKMIETSFGGDDAEAITRDVMQELDSIETESEKNEAQAGDIKVEVLAALLHDRLRN